jgi:hypothetical protein
MRLETNRLTLTNEGKLLADGIAADLFFMEKQAPVNVAGGGPSNTRSPGLPTG